MPSKRAIWIARVARLMAGGAALAVLVASPPAEARCGTGFVEVFDDVTGRATCVAEADIRRRALEQSQKRLILDQRMRTRQRTQAQEALMEKQRRRQRALMRRQRSLQRRR